MLPVIRLGFPAVFILVIRFLRYINDVTILVGLYDKGIQAVVAKCLCQFMSRRETVAFRMFLAMDAVDKVLVGRKCNSDSLIFSKVYCTQPFESIDGRVEMRVDTVKEYVVEKTIDCFVFEIYIQECGVGSDSGILTDSYIEHPLRVIDRHY